jgi:hypothetical protein
MTSAKSSRSWKRKRVWRSRTARSGSR